MARQKPDRKKFMIRLIAIVLVALLIGGVIFSSIITLAYADELSGHTDLTLTIDEALGGAYARQETTYVNRTGKALNQVLFSINLNALRRAETTPVEPQDFNDAYPAGFTPGGVELFEVMVDGAPANWGAQGEGEAFIRVDCDIAPGACAQFSFGYELLLPKARTFSGIDEMGWRLAFFYFQPVYYDQALEQFSAMALTPVGSAMYFDFQPVTLALDVPDTYLVASGGAQEASGGAIGRKLINIKWADARDVALALSRRYAVSERAGDVHLAAYGNDARACARALDAAEKAVSVFSEMLGKCPVELIDIAKVGSPIPSSAHSGSIWVSDAVFSDAVALERAVVYGVAKQWFGQCVMVDPEREAWLTDALCTYLTCLYEQQVYGEARFLDMLNRVCLDALKQTVPGALMPDSDRALFPSAAAYQAVVVGRGTAVLNEVRKTVGDQAFRAALASFYQENAGGVASVEQFAGSINRASGRELDRYLRDTLDTIGNYVNHNMDTYE
ncbi:MAG: M1 family aminopeptidase [Clostridia bacterium]